MINTVPSLVKATGKVLSSPFKKNHSKQHAMVMEAVMEEVEGTCSQSHLLHKSAWDAVDLYDPEDISVGKLLKGGAFFDTFKIRRLPDMDRSEGSSRGGYSSSEEDVSHRHCAHKTHKRHCYVVKQLNHKVFSENCEVLQEATLRLVLEAKYLARLDHRNLVRVKGMPFGEESHLTHGAAAAPGSFFMVTSRMVETLSDRVARWRQYPAGDKRKEVESFHGLTFHRKLGYAKDLAKVLQYLHKNNLVLLNLSPSTIGFLEDGTLQISDLSCVQELPQEPSCNDDENHRASISDDSLPQHLKRIGNERYPATATTGTSLLVQIAADGGVPRYVAPEVVLQQPGKNWMTPKADTYSFALVLFELLTLSQPFVTFKAGQHRMKVCLNGHRPNLSVYKLPTELEMLLHHTWRKSSSKRLNMTEVLQAMPEPKSEAVSVTPRQA